MNSVGPVSDTIRTQRAGFISLIPEKDMTFSEKSVFRTVEDGCSDVCFGSRHMAIT